MIQFPDAVSLEIHGQNIHFHIKQIDTNLYEVQLHAMTDIDDVTFGYIVYDDHYVYAYCASVNDDDGIVSTEDKHLVYASYVGPEQLLNDNDGMDEILHTIVRSIATAVFQFCTHRNKHTAYVNQEQFEKLYRQVVNAVNSKQLSVASPVLTSVYNMAISMRDYYDALAKDIFRITSEKDKAKND